MGARARPFSVVCLVWEPHVDGHATRRRPIQADGLARPEFKSDGRWLCNLSDHRRDHRAKTHQRARKTGANVVCEHSRGICGCTWSSDSDLANLPSSIITCSDTLCKYHEDQGSPEISQCMQNTNIYDARSRVL